MKWRIYYADGTTHETESPGDIPLAKRFAVQIIVQDDPDHGRQLIHFADYYLWRADLGKWIGVAGDASALMALTTATADITCVLWGSMMDPYDWAKIQKAAREDPGFADWNGERRHDRVRK